MALFNENCSNCGADYIIDVVEDSSSDLPTICPFCGDELETYILVRDTIQELDFDGDDE